MRDPKRKGRLRDTDRPRDQEMRVAQNGDASIYGNVERARVCVGVVVVGRPPSHRPFNYRSIFTLPPLCYAVSPICALLCLYSILACGAAIKTNPSRTRRRPYHTHAKSAHSHPQVGIAALLFIVGGRKALVLVVVVVVMEPLTILSGAM